ncbi:MAG TPA: DNA recombination protein RmuC [Sphingobium sp.]|uniref:DNA recombination protein RmuC n=1 Tax=Sphingobium sp. TaxID=1912891 RepID=UPI002ED646FC
MDLSVILIFVVALSGGFVAAWLLRGRDVVRLSSERTDFGTRLEASEGMRNAALRDLAVEKSRAEEAAGWRAQTERVTVERDRAVAENLALKAEHQARMESFEAQIAALQEAREQLSAQFSEIGGKLLENAQRAFLERANERFTVAQEKNETQIKALLNPVEVTLKRYEEGLGRVERDRVESYSALREQVEQVRAGQNQVRDETARLVNALRSSPKARGRWGEQQLRNVLEMAGLSEHADFRAEVSVNTEDGRLRPDVIVRLPGGKQLIIDAKCSLNAYLEAAEAEDEVTRVAHLRAHAGAIRTHAQQLGAKEYWTRFGDAADYVVMFIPGEHFLSAALEQDSELWEWAFQRKVLLATPTNLVAIARTVASVWRQEKLAEDAQQIAVLGKEMYERLGVAAGHLRSLGKGLNSAVSNYNNFVRSFDSRVLVTGRKFRDLNVEAAKEIEAVDGIELLATLPEAAVPTATGALEVGMEERDAAE